MNFIESKLKSPFVLTLELLLLGVVVVVSIEIMVKTPALPVTT